MTNQPEANPSLSPTQNEANPQTFGDTTPQAAAAQPAPFQPTVNPVPQKLPSLMSKLIPIFLVLGAVSFGSLIYVIIQNSQKKEPDQVIKTVVVTPTPSPTPIRVATVISTSSAYMELEKSIDEFEAALNEFSKDDPMLSPPTLVLPLGF